jgi:hypothetical protein
MGDVGISELSSFVSSLTLGYYTRGSRSLNGTRGVTGPNEECRVASRVDHV